MKTKSFFISCLCALMLLNGCAQEENSRNIEKVNSYNVIWNSPSKDSRGSMPMGNGDLGINLWVEENGDLQFYISKTDAWSENARLLKLGKVRMSLSPNPFKTGEPYRQELHVKDGVLSIEAGEQENKVSINVRVDAFHPVVELSVRSKKNLTAKVKTEPWRTERRKLEGGEVHSAYGIVQKDIYVEKDSIPDCIKDGIVWMHRNRRSIWKENLELQSLDTNGKDPLMNRTFGCLIKSDRLHKDSSVQLSTDSPVKDFFVSVYAYTNQTQTVNEWLSGIETLAQQISSESQEKRLNAHKARWQDMWERSYIHFSSSDSLDSQKVAQASKAYTLQRYMNICSGRGKYPIKFNGSIFTVDTKKMKDRFGGFDADYRQWGGPYWWQNTRLPYWSMLESGDFDLMRPLFEMYSKNLAIRQEATRKYYNHEGAFYPETMYFWGTYTDSNYGKDRTDLPLGMTSNLFIRYYWQSGLEISLMMLDYYQYTLDETFMKEQLLPVISNVVTFFDQHWKRDQQGKILFEPAMALETYRTAVNPLPEIVGINKVCTELLRLPDSLTTEKQRQNWKRLISELPDIPLREVDGKQILAPAQSFKDKQNVENPELYAIFPYRKYGVGKADLELAVNTFNNRSVKQTGGWQQNAIKAACLGLSDEASELMLRNFNTKNPDFRFPTMWGPNYDWIPDQDHGTVAMSALQRMILQSEGDEIHLFPAWPKKWDVSFKLYAPKNTIIKGVYKNGKIENLEVTPESRKKNLIFWLK